MTDVDLARPGMRAEAPRRAARELAELTDAFNRHARRGSRTSAARPGRAVLRAQEQERGRIAQDLHDEVNQALTAILLRLSATIQDAPRRAALRAAGDPGAGHPGDGRAARARPPAAPDRARRPRADRGARLAGLRLRPAHGHAQARFHHTGELPRLSDEEQLVIFRVTQESLSNIAKHAGAQRRRRRAVVRRPHGAARPRRRRRLRPRGARAAATAARAAAPAASA